MNPARVAREEFTGVKHLLADEVTKAGISKMELARRLDVDEKQVRRLLDPNITSRLDNIAAAFKALGLSLHVKIGR